ncbi:MAG: SNF2-related protein [Myxococcota bacterium]|nr:SNF2-related protein [Myxococcota bacterium]
MNPETPDDLANIRARDWVRWGMRLRRGEQAVPLSSPRKIGQLELADFQARAAERVCQTSLKFGGALLADAPGLGKTRVGLVAAQRLRKVTDAAAPILCCAPSRLLSRWRRAFASAGLREGSDVLFCSHASLSRWNAPLHDPCVLLVDEAHRFRNPDARRSQMLASLAVRAHVVLVTATPVCKSLDDLRHLFAYFLSDDASRKITGEDLGDVFVAAERGDGFGLDRLIEAVVTRREQAPMEEGFGKRPGVRLEMLEYVAGEHEEWLWQNLGRIANELELVLLESNWPRGLLAEHLLRRWESGPRALHASLESLRHYHQRWLDAARQGIHLDRSSFKALFEASSTDAGQGVFAFLLPETETPPDEDVIEVVEANLSVLDDLLEACSRCRQNFGRDGAILELLEEFQEEKFLIFTGFVDAALGLFETLCDFLGSTAQIGLITGAGARATGIGAASAQELLARFAPIAQEQESCSPHHGLRILIATDCLSEGVDLQDCGRMILADLPYTPLAIEQRVGRLLRPGSPHDEVVAYLPRPSSWPDSLGMRRRLDERLGVAESAHAKYIAASALSTSSGEKRSSPDVLAAQETLDRWMHRELSVTSEGEQRSYQGAWRTYHPRCSRGVWALVQSGEGEGALVSWWHVGSNGEMRRTCADVLPELIAFFDHDPELERDRCGEAANAECFLAAHEARRLSHLLLAAHMAPYRLSASSPQVRLWKERLVTSGVLSEEEQRRWRARLLRPHMRGIELLLERLLERAPPVREVLKVLERWLPEVDEEALSSAPRVELLGTVAIRTDRTLAPLE